MAEVLRYPSGERAPGHPGDDGSGRPEAGLAPAGPTGGRLGAADARLHAWAKNERMF